MASRSSLIACFATLLLGAAVGCSDEEGSTIDPSPPASAGTSSNSGGTSTTAGSSSKVPTSGSSTGGSASGGSAGGTSAPSAACPGLPIASSVDAGGAPPEAAGGSGAGETSEAGGPAETGDTACNGVSVEAEAVPVDVFVMMDRSQSMGKTVTGKSITRWQALHDAVQSFAEDPKAADIRAGIGFFSLSGSGDDAGDCSQDAYAEPKVPIGLISDVGLDLVDAMDGVSPGGFTPIEPAIKGAISYARAWAKDNPGRATLVVLVTDGYPTQCGDDPDQITQATRAGYESAERIRTFVIGVGDVAKFNLNNYARAGGSVQAYLTDSGDVTRTFVDALNNITNRDLACEYQLPEPPQGMKFDPAKVQVVYTPSTGDAEEVPSISSVGACSKNVNGGWYYDDAENPTKISVCPCTCTRFQAGRVDVRLGCKPRLGLR